MLPPFQKVKAKSKSEKQIEEFLRKKY